MTHERAVVVGAGSISGAWFPGLKAEGVNVAAVVDINLTAAQRRIEEYELEAAASTDLLRTLEETRPDFVLDLTVPEARHLVVSTALQAGYHVLSEKPMAATMSQASDLLQLAQKTGKLFMVSQSRRWDANHALLKDLVRRDAVGALSTINCDFYTAAHFGGFRDLMASPLILDMAIHHFDLARFITDADPVAVYAKEFNPKISWYAGNASASCIFEMTDGVIFTYRGSWCSEGCHTSWNGNWRLIGEKGTLLYEQDNKPRGQVVAGTEGFLRPLEDLDVPEPVMEFTGMRGALREMLSFLRSGSMPQTECNDNIKSLSMVFAAIESASRGERVRIEAN